MAGQLPHLRTPAKNHRRPQTRPAIHPPSPSAIPPSQAWINGKPCQGPIDGGEEIFFIEWRRPPTREAQARLRTLTQAQNQFHRQTGALLIPRRGTLSPWASKATDIAHRCGLELPSRTGPLVCRRKTSRGSPRPHDTNAPHPRGMARLARNLRPPARRPSKKKIDLGDAPIDRLNEINARHGFALNTKEIEHLADCYHRLSRPPQLGRAHDVRPSQLRTLSSQNLPRRMDGKRRITHGHDSPHPRRRPPRHHPRLHRQRRHHHRRRRRRIPP